MNQVNYNVNKMGAAIVRYNQLIDLCTLAPEEVATCESMLLGPESVITFKVIYRS